MAETLADFVRRHKPKRFAPVPYYVSESDTVVFFFKEAASFAERIDGLLTIYRSQETDELVGCEIKGVKRKLEMLGAFGVLLDDLGKTKRIKLGLLFLAAMANAREGEPKRTYEELGTIAKATGAELDAKELLAA